MNEKKKPSNKVRVSYFLPDLLLNDVKEQMISQGYDLKSKSKWISEAVQDLLCSNNYIDLVNLNEQMQGFEKLDYLTIDRKIKGNIDKAIIEIRKVHPSIEGVQSKIIRTAIVQRLLK